MGLFSKNENCEVNTAAKPQGVSARVTVKRRESSGLNSFEVWDIYLNGESLGRVEDGASVTAETNKRNNVLEARDNKGFVSDTLKFSAQSEARAEVALRGGKFTDAQGMDIILPFGKPGVFGKTAGVFGKIKGAYERILGDYDSKRRVLFYWAVLIAYSTAAFFLCRGLMLLALALPLFPVIVTASAAGSVHSGMAGYLHERHPEEWGSIALEKSKWLRGGPSLLCFDWVIVGDPDYRELRNRYKRARRALGFSLCAYFLTFIYAAVTIARR